MNRAWRANRKAAASLVWVTTGAAILLVLLWARHLTPALLWSGAAVTLLAAVLIVSLRDAPSRPWLLAALPALVVALIAAAGAQREFTRIEFDWTRVALARSRQMAARLDEVMAGLVSRGQRAAEQAARASESDSAGAFARLATVRDRTGVDALALFGPDGALQAWAGEHRGNIPEAVRRGPRLAHFAERPLYSYLYFAAPVKGGRHTVAAVLVESGGLERGAERGLTTTVAEGTNVPALFRSGAGHGDDVAWSLVIEGDTVAYARLAPMSQRDVRTEVALRAERLVVAFAFLALILVSVGWLRWPGVAGERLASSAPLLIVAVAAATAPLGEVLGLEGNATALAFFLPVPLPVPSISLGDVIALLVAAAALASTMRSATVSTPRQWRTRLIVLVLALSLVYALALRVLLGSAAASLLEGGTGLWFSLQLAGTLFLATVTALVLPARTDSVERRAVSITLIAAALALAALLAIVVHLHAYRRQAAVPWLAALWAAPLLLLGLGTAGVATVRERVTRWTAVGFLAATAVLPQLWGAHTAARLRAAELELRTFGTEPRPIVDYLLQAFAREALARYNAGEDGVQLLYRSWVASGLAQEPFAVRITLWRGGAAEVELGPGGARGSDATDRTIRALVLQDARHGVPRVGFLPGYPNVSTMLTVPLQDTTRVISVTVEPRRSLQRTGVIAAFLGASPPQGAAVTLIPATGSAQAGDSIRWLPTPRGFRSELQINYPDGLYHAHMDVRFTPPGMRLARATLLLTFDLGVLLLLWAVGHIARGIPVLHRTAVREWLSSFRTRVSAALFLFFLVPTTFFGWLAYRGLSGVVIEAGNAIADRAAEQAVREWPQTGGDLRELSDRAGADVLYYLGGELANASSPEGPALGLYGAWMSPRAYRALSGGEETSERDVSRLNGQSFLTAYHVLRPSGTLGVPVALSVGDTATRQRDIADLTLLAAVLGLLLSGVLSVAVGRALAGPIGMLQRAAAAVGAGRLSVRMPEPSGEFGQLFASFNRMVRRLRRARVQEVRTARVLAWGEMARQIAHEIKNPLTPIKLAVQHLRRAHRDQRPDFGRVLDENVEQVLVEIDRLAEISRAFSRYGAPQEEAGPLSTVDVRAVIHEAITLYRAGESSVSWQENVDPELPLGRARTAELREVLMNLLENARDAVREDGSVMVSATRLDGSIALEVSDDGRGIPPDLVPRIFDPHFSTRSSGTGLGLAIVRRLVEGWGGSVDVDSQPGVGTSFRVLIPAADN